jgi:hypothetical protein
MALSLRDESDIRRRHATIPHRVSGKLNLRTLGNFRITALTSVKNVEVAGFALAPAQGC